MYLSKPEGPIDMGIKWAIKCDTRESSKNYAID